MTEASHRIRAIAEPLAASLNITLWGVDVQFGPRSMVRVFVEKDDGVSIDDCAELSRLLGLSLEVEDFLENAYVLEVSSPGLDRIFFTLEQLAGACGKKVEISLFSPVPEFPRRRKFVGLLRAVEDEAISLALEDASVTGNAGDVVTLFWSKVKKARQVYVAPEKPLPGKKPLKKSLSKKKEPSAMKEGFSAEESLT